MNVFVRSIALLGFGFLLLILQSTFGALASWYPYTPNLLLPMVIFLGVSPDVSIVRGTAISFVLGYLLDLFCGNLMSLHTFVMVATFMLARGAGLRLFLRGPVFQIVLTFVVGVLSSGAVVALRAIFQKERYLPPQSFGEIVLTVGTSALVTAAAAPLVFLVARRIDAVMVRRREEAGVAS